MYCCHAPDDHIRDILPHVLQDKHVLSCVKSIWLLQGSFYLPQGFRSWFHIKFFRAIQCLDINRFILIIHCGDCAFPANKGNFITHVEGRIIFSYVAAARRAAAAAAAAARRAAAARSAAAAAAAARCAAAAAARRAAAAAAAA